jgi:hypothetical protein
VVERSGLLICVSVNRRLLLSAGHADGTVCCRQIDTHHSHFPHPSAAPGQATGQTGGTVVACGDFLAHKHPVCGIASDVIPGTNSVVVASVDTYGTICVWTLFQTSSSGAQSNGGGGHSTPPPTMSSSATSGSAAGTQNASIGAGAAGNNGTGSAVATADVQYGISRRPQRLFRAEPSPCTYAHMPDVVEHGISSSHSTGMSVGASAFTGLCASIDLSWNMGIVAVGIVSVLRIFSIERDELVRCIDLRSLFISKVDTDVGRESADCTSSTYCEAYRMPQMAATLLPADIGRNNDISFAVHRVCLSTDGFAIIHIAYKRGSGSQFEDLMGDSSEERSVILSLSMSGAVCGVFHSQVMVTYLSCPNHGAVCVVGTCDGRVIILRAGDLYPLHTFWLAKHCRIVCSPSLTHAHSTSRTDSGTGSNSDSNSSTSALSMSAIVSVSVGPDPSCPALLVATTASQEVFVQPLPDFVSWEKVRTPSTLQALAAGPLRAVNRTLQQAHNIGAWGAEQAENLADKASQIAQDTLQKVTLYLRIPRLY